MSLLLTGLWPGLAASVLLGLLVGALAGLPADRVGGVIALVLGLALAALAGLAVTQSLPGRIGFWAETAAWMLAAYLAGCAAGGLGRAILVRRSG